MVFQGIGDAMIFSGVGDVGGNGFEFFPSVSHGNAVNDGAEHVDIVQAIAEGHGVRKRDVEMLADFPNACGFAAVFIEQIDTVAMPGYDFEIFR